MRSTQRVPFIYTDLRFIRICAYVNSIVRKSIAHLMFCGDDTGGVVVDVGAHACKFGYAGDDVPRAIFPGVRDTRSRVQSDSRALVFTRVPTPVCVQRVGVLADETSSSKGGSRQRIVVGNSARLFRPSMEIKRAVEFGVGACAFGNGRLALWALSCKATRETILSHAACSGRLGRAGVDLGARFQRTKMRAGGTSGCYSGAVVRIRCAA